MAKRAKLTIGALAASKEAGEVIATPPEPASIERPVVTRGRGRPRKVDETRKLGQTLRLPLPLWQALRQAVEIEEMNRKSEKTPRVLGSHIIEAAIREHLERKYRIKLS